MPNALYYGDSLRVLREYVPDESVDMVYQDPPFNSNDSYSVPFREKMGGVAGAEKAFTYTWEWTQKVERSYGQREIIGNPMARPLAAAGKVGKGAADSFLQA